MWKKFVIRDRATRRIHGSGMKNSRLFYRKAPAAASTVRSRSPFDPKIRKVNLPYQNLKEKAAWYKVWSAEVHQRQPLKPRGSFVAWPPNWVTVDRFKASRQGVKLTLKLLLHGRRWTKRLEKLTWHRCGTPIGSGLKISTTQPQMKLGCYVGKQICRVNPFVTGKDYDHGEWIV